MAPSHPGFCPGWIDIEPRARFENDNLTEDFGRLPRPVDTRKDLLTPPTTKAAARYLLDPIQPESSLDIRATIGTPHHWHSVCELNPFHSVYTEIVMNRRETAFFLYFNRMSDVTPKSRFYAD